MADRRVLPRAQLRNPSHRPTPTRRTVLTSGFACAVSGFGPLSPVLAQGVTGPDANVIALIDEWLAYEPKAAQLLKCINALFANDEFEAAWALEDKLSVIEAKQTPLEKRILVKPAVTFSGCRAKAEMAYALAARFDFEPCLYHTADAAAHDVVKDMLALKVW